MPTADVISLIARYSIAGTILETGTFTEKDAEAIAAWLAAYKTYDQYRSRLWSAAEELFNGGKGRAFSKDFTRAIYNQLNEAWVFGAADIGVDPDEMTDADITVRDAIINNETDFIHRLAGDIADARDAGMTPEQFDKQFGSRIDLWANRYNETINRAHMQMGSKQRFVWRLGNREEHCPECNSLDGITAFGYEFEEARIHPQMPKNELLTCQGWNCGCSLEPTTNRRTGRALDRLTQIAMRHAGG
jgi:hypothetical protein